MNNRVSGIYLIFNRVNKKKYVGQAVDILDRWTNHKSLLNNNKHNNRHLQGAWNKYGESAFKFTKIEEVELNKDKLKEREQFWINKLDVCNPEKGYNIHKIAGSPLGTKHNKETKQKMKESALIREQKIRENGGLSKETKEKMKLAKLGKKQKPESIQKSAQSRKGIKQSKETIEKRIATKKLNNKPMPKMSDEHKKIISQACKGRTPWNKGKKMSEDSIKKQQETRKRNAKVVSEETRKKMGAWQIGRKRSEQTIQRIKETKRKNKEFKQNQEKFDEFGFYR